MGSEEEEEEHSVEELQKEQCNGNQPAGDKDNDLLITAIPFELTESVNDRLILLQQLIPHGQEIDKEEILQVAIEYVRGLEKEIQMYDRSKQDENKMEQGPLDKSPSSSDNTLQKRGLCVVPLSVLHKVF